MDSIVRYIRQLGQPFTDKSALRIKTFALSGRVKDAEIRRGIGTGRSGPLPATVVGSQIAIQQLGHEILFTGAPVDQQILDQETGHDHPQAIMHPAGLIELTHGSIDNRVTGIALLPGQ
ncbi:hypothetical protein D3C76_1455960 [compost metagenome]